MSYLTFDIHKNYLEDAAKKLKIPNFPDWWHINQKAHQFQNLSEEDAFLYTTLQWMDLLEKKYKELTTALVYSLAYHNYAEAHNLYAKNNPSDFFYIPELAFFIESSSSRAFSLCEKLAQLLNVYLKMGFFEKYEYQKPSVSFKAVYRRVNDQYITILAPLKQAIEELEEARHRHEHRFSPEHIRWIITPTKGVIIESNGKRKKTTFLVSNIDKTVLPITPFQQIQKAHKVQLEFQKAISNIIKIIEKELG